MLANGQKYNIARMVVNKTLTRRQACENHGILLSSLQYYCKRVRVDTEVLNYPGRHRLIDSVRNRNIQEYLKANYPIEELTLKKIIRQAAKDTYHARNSRINPNEFRKNHKYISQCTLSRYIKLYKSYSFAYQEYDKTCSIN
jgi:hypothetical protein